MSEQAPIWMWEIINIILPYKRKRPLTVGGNMSDLGDIARQKLHDLRWGPHIDDDVERQEILDEAISAALGAVAALEAKLEAMKQLMKFAQHDYRCEARNGVESCACGYAKALAVAQEEQK